MRKSTGMRNAWIATALVVMAALVLAGCPHNGLLERGGGARGGGSEVTLIITNFVDGGPVTNRSALSGPMRTIAPEHIDLTQQAEIGKYVFVAYATGNGTWGPEFIDISQGTGQASLNISGGGTYNITVEGYDVEKLRQEGLGNDKADILANKIPADVIAVKDSTMVLSGSATVDLAGGRQVTLALTNDGVGTEGDVNVTINFGTPQDVTTINNSNYIVRAALYSYDDGEMVQAGGQSTQQELNTQGALANPEVFNVSDVPKGHYQFRLTVVDPADNNKEKASWHDDIFVEGNRSTAKEITVYDLFSIPATPTALEVYWSAKRTTEVKEGFLSYLVWGGLSYNAVGVDVEIADITKWYSAAGADDQVDFGTGAATIGDRAALWNLIDALPKAGAGAGGVSYEDVVTTLPWNDSPQKAAAYPAIWMSGSQLGGSNGVVFLMQDGHVYSVRIRASSAQGTSDWLVVGTGTTTAPQLLPDVPAIGVQTATKFNRPATNGLFDLIEIHYNLGGQYVLYKSTGTAIGTPATAAELLSYHEYQAGQDIDISMKYNDMTAPQQDDWFLYPKTTAGGLPPALLTDRVMHWSGWQDKLDGNKRFGPNPLTWTYSGSTSLQLIPVGAGGGSLTIKAKTSDTFNVFTEDTVLVQIRNDGNTAAPTTGWTQLTNGVDNPTNPGTGDAKTIKLSLMNDTNRYIINLDSAARTGAGGTTTWLYVSAGDDPTAPGAMTDKSSDPFTVKGISAVILRGTTEMKRFTVGSGAVAYMQLDGMASGDYTLRIEFDTSGGYRESYQTPLVIKYNDQTYP